AKLWSAGYVWQDVFRQSRDRLIFDVIAEWIDDLRSWFDRDKRAEVRARWRMQSRRPSFLTPSPQPSAVGGVASVGMSHAELSMIGATRADVAKRALQDRDEVLQLIATLPAKERK